MPELVGLSERDALAALARVGLTARPSRYRHEPDRADRVVEQSVAAGSVVSAQSLVDLQVGVALAVPSVTAPVGVPVVGVDDPMPVLQWTPGPAFQRRWLVTIELETCTSVQPVPSGVPVPGHETCEFNLARTEAVDVATFTPGITLTPMVRFTGSAPRLSNPFHSGWVRWHVAALDDFGTIGPASEYALFRIG